jgi:hypothetical protein
MRVGPVKRIIPWALLVSNLVGIFFYLKNASLAWAIPEEAGLNPATAGVAMVWGLGALPILLLFLIVNGMWWSVILSRRLKKWPASVASLLWVLAVVIDFWHH